MTAETTLTQLNLGEHRCAPVMRFPMGSDAELLYFPLKKEAKLVSPAEARLLSACGQFATLESHAKRLLKSLPPGTADAPGLVELLKTFVESGMMLPYADLMKRVASFPKPEPPPRIAWLAIPTCNRPELLRRCIRSYRDHFRKFGRFPKLLVADDSNTTEMGASTKAVVEEAAKTWGSAVEYVGLEEKRRLIDRLAEGGEIPRDILEFGILGPGGPTQGAGANRNAIMLQTMGDLVLSVDDDTVCEPCVAPEPERDGLKFGSDSDPSEYWFFADRQAALGFVRPAEIDVLAGHERLLGRPVHSLAHSPGGAGDADIGSSCGHLLQSFWQGQGDVLITSNGGVGDSGMHSGRNFPLHRSAGTRSRLLATEEHYRSALRSREISVRFYRRPYPTAAHSSACFLGSTIGRCSRRSFRLGIAMTAYSRASPTGASGVATSDTCRGR